MRNIVIYSSLQMIISDNGRCVAVAFNNVNKSNIVMDTCVADN